MKTPHLLLAFHVAFAGLASVAVAQTAAPGPALVAMGAKFEKNWQFKEPALIFRADAPLTPEQWAEIEALAPVRIAANGKGVDDAALQRFAKLAVEEFATDGSSITDEGFAAFVRMPRLVRLSVSHNLVIKTAPGLAGHPSLQVVNFGGTRIGDGALPVLASIRTLRELSLHHCGVTDAGLAALERHPALEKLTLDPQFKPWITDACIGVLVTLPRLRELAMNETVLSLQGLSRLKAVGGLQKLTLQKNGIAAADVEKLRGVLTGVEIRHEPADEAAVAKWNAALKRP